MPRYQILLRDGHDKKKLRDVEIQRIKRFILSKPATVLVRYKLKQWLLVALKFLLTSKTAFIWSWLICFCTTTCMILTIGFTFALGVLLPVFMDSFKENRGKTGELKTMARLLFQNYLFA